MSGQVLWIEAPRGASSQTGSQLLFSESHPPHPRGQLVGCSGSPEGRERSHTAHSHRCQPDEHVEGAPPPGESAGLHPRRDLLVAGCQTGDNLGPREEAPLSACQGQACVPHEPQ